MLLFTNCVNCIFDIQGTLKASDDTTYWSTAAGMIYLNGIVGVTIKSSNGLGVLDGNGQTSYDRWAASLNFARPTAIYINGGKDIYISGLTLKNVPNAFFGQKGGVTNVNYASLTLTAASKSTNAPKNTDGFDIGESTYTTLKNIYVSNQDDCVAFKSGCNYVEVDTITCAGTNHGLSVGSLGKTNADWVKNVYVKNADSMTSFLSFFLSSLSIPLYFYLHFYLHFHFHFHFHFFWAIADKGGFLYSDQVWQSSRYQTLPRRLRLRQRDRLKRHLGYRHRGWLCIRHADPILLRELGRHLCDSS